MADTRIKGVDISVYQDGIPFDEMIAAGVKFAIIRAGCGKTKDRLVDKFVDECKKHNMPFGFYWYLCGLTVERAKEEAERCVEVCKGYKPDYPIYCDIEDKSQIDQLNTRTRTDMVHAFCAVVSNAGFMPGVYANPSWFNSFLYKKELINDYEIWLAHWTEDPNRPSKYKANQKVWQWGLDRIAGYNVDGDISFFDYSGGKEIKPDEKPETVIPDIIEVGDIVKFKGGLHYYQSTSKTATGGARTPGLAKVQCIAESAPHKYALIGVEGGSNVYGWVDENLVEAVEDTPDTFALGDKVKVRKGAKTYSGHGKKPVALARFVYNTVFTVMQIGAGIAPDYIVIGINGSVTAGMNAADLEKA